MSQFLILIKSGTKLGFYDYTLELVIENETVSLKHNINTDAKSRVNFVNKNRQRTDRLPYNVFIITLVYTDWANTAENLNLALDLDTTY